MKGKGTRKATATGPRPRTVNVDGKSHALLFELELWAQGPRPAETGRNAVQEAVEGYLAEQVERFFPSRAVVKVDYWRERCLKTRVGLLRSVMNTLAEFQESHEIPADMGGAVERAALMAEELAAVAVNAAGTSTPGEVRATWEVGWPERLGTLLDRTRVFAGSVERLTEAETRLATEDLRRTVEALWGVMGREDREEVARWMGRVLRDEEAAVDVADTMRHMKAMQALRARNRALDEFLNEVREWEAWLPL